MCVYGTRIKILLMVMSGFILFILFYWINEYCTADWDSANSEKQSDISLIWMGTTWVRCGEQICIIRAVRCLKGVLLKWSGYLPKLRCVYYEIPSLCFLAKPQERHSNKLYVKETNTRRYPLHCWNLILTLVKLVHHHMHWNNIRRVSSLPVWTND